MQARPVPHRVVLLLALAFAVLAGCGSSTPRLAPLNTGAILLAFGDSLTLGTGAEAQASYPAVLQKLVGRRVVSAGVPGELTQEGLARLPGVLAEVRPQILILCHGGNDFLRRRDDAQTAANLRAMVRVAGDQGIPVVLVAVPKPGLILSTPGLYRDIGREFNTPVENSVMTNVLGDNELKSDLIHPNAKGYARIAEAVAALLHKAGAV